MIFDDFKKCLCDAYRRGEVSDSAVKGMNELSNTFDLPSLLPVLELSKVEQPNLVFRGASDSAVIKLEATAPKISIIIPTYNRSALLCRCIDSILKQDYENFEIIVVNDCSTDDTASIIEKRYGSDSRVVYIENETNLGPGKNRQKAYLVSKGEYVIFADDDDYYLDFGFFRKALALFYDYDNLSMVGANSIFFDEVVGRFHFEPLTFCGVMKSEDFFFGFVSKYRKPNSTFPAVFKKTVLEKANFADMNMMNDASIYMRAACFGDVCMMKDWVGVYWFHDSNISKKLPFDFIIENLDEKNNIYRLACAAFSVKRPDWLITQQMHTISYYINSGSLGRRKYLKLKRWIKNNGGDVKDELLALTKKRYHQKQS